MRLLEHINISRAIKALSNGKLVVVPTETVYGIVGNALNKDTYLRLNAIKNRPKDKKYTLFVKDLEEIEKYSFVDKTDRQIIDKMMPGSLTYVLKARNLPDYLVSDDGTIAFRIPKGTVISEIMKSVDYPLLSTSANVSGENIKSDIVEIKSIFGKGIAFYLNGRAGGGTPSTIIKREGDTIDILRRGPYKIADFVDFGLKIRIRDKLRILFVCYANIVRSPIAEYYFKKHCDCDVKSAGIGAKAGKFPPKEAIEISKSVGIDVTHHFSHPLKEEDLEHADLIFATDNMVRAHIYDVMGYKSKIHLISDFSEKMRGELIPDPYKFGLDAYYKMISILKYHLDELLKWSKENIKSG